MAESAVLLIRLEWKRKREKERRGKKIVPVDICSQFYSYFWEGGLPAPLNGELVVSHSEVWDNRCAVTDWNAHMEICSGLLTCSKEALCSCHEARPSLLADFRSCPSLVGSGRTKPRAQHHSPSPSITHPGPATNADMAGVNSSVGPASWGVHPGKNCSGGPGWQPHCRLLQMGSTAQVQAPHRRCRCPVSY